MLVSNYLKRPDYRDVKEYDLRVTYLPARPLLFIPTEAMPAFHSGRQAGGRFMLDTAPKLLFHQLHTIAKQVN